MTQQFLVSLLLFFVPLTAWCDDGDIFTAPTVEGVEMTFQVLSEEEKTVMVGVGEWNAPAINELSEGVVTIPSEVNGYHVIGLSDGAFAGCIYINCVFIPSTVKILGVRLFMACVHLEYVYSDVIEPKNCSILTFTIELPPEPDCVDCVIDYGACYNNATLFVPAGCRERYVQTEGWNLFQNIVETGASNIPAKESEAVKTEWNNKTYDLSGRRISGTPTRGVYIRGGRKYVVND